MLNKSSKSGHPRLFPDLRGKAFSFSPFSVMLAVGLSYMAGLYCVEVYSLYTHFVGNFYHKWMLNFVKCFSCIYWDYHMIFVPHIVNWCITLIALWMLNNPYILRINPSWSWCMILWWENSYFVFLPRHFLVWQSCSHLESGHLDKDPSLGFLPQILTLLFPGHLLKRLLKVKLKKS